MLLKCRIALYANVLRLEELSEPIAKTPTYGACAKEVVLAPGYRAPGYRLKWP